MNRIGGGVLKKGRFDHFAHILDPRRNGRQREEGAFEFRGHDLSQRGLPHPRRPPEDERRDVARLQKLAENAVAAHQMLLPDVVVERAGTEAFGQRNRHKLTVEQSNVRFFHGTAKRMPETCGRHLAQNRKSLCAKRTTNPHREKSGKRNGDGSAIKKETRARACPRSVLGETGDSSPIFHPVGCFWRHLLAPKGGRTRYKRIPEAGISPIPDRAYILRTFGLPRK